MKKKYIIKTYIVLFITTLFITTFLFGQDKPADRDLRIFSDNTRFENANQFYKLGKFTKALGLLNEYLEIYPNGLHRKEAFKIIASIYFNEYNYFKAIKFYNSLYEEHNNTEEGIEAFFMTGICYQKMGFADSAKKIFNTIIEEHPGSGYAYQSKIKLDLISILEDS
ncbi:MAG: tetratricopeptide repeat protein [Spirochaetes bacterium]|nr:tetratricopeptide repeat protein [Spirochaetota bacterium]